MAAGRAICPPGANGVPLTDIEGSFVRSRRTATKLECAGVYLLRLTGREQFVDRSILHGIAMADTVMLATAQRLRATLWTQDSDFDGLLGVKYYAKR